MLIGLDLNSIPMGWIIGLFISIGTAIGLVIAYFASREYIKRTIEVLQDTIKSHEINLKAKDDLALSIAETVKQLYASLEEKLRVMTEERDSYRTQLHDTRGPMQSLTLEVQTLKLRPDLNQVLEKEEQWHQRREQFYSDMAGNQRLIIDTQHKVLQLMGEIKVNVDSELKQSNEVCATVGKALQDIAGKMDDRETAAAERDTAMMDVLVAIKDELKIKNGSPTL